MRSCGGRSGQTAAANLMRLASSIERAGRAPGAVEVFIGEEMDHFLGSNRKRSVHEVALIEKTDPEAANTFHRIIVHLLGERTVHLIRTVDALQR